MAEELGCGYDTQLGCAVILLDFGWAVKPLLGLYSRKGDILSPLHLVDFNSALGCMGTAQQSTQVFAIDRVLGFVLCTTEMGMQKESSTKLWPWKEQEHA